MPMKSQTRYLRDFFYSALRQHVAQAQKKAKATQWINFIKALTQKGVRELEIKDTGILDRLSQLPGDASIAREAVLDLIDANQVSIRETVLPKGEYQSYALKGYDRYQETLYVLESERDHIQFALNQIRFEIEELNFDLDALATNPERVFELDAQRQELLKRLPFAADFKRHHYSAVQDPFNPGTPVRNLLAHTRVTRRGDVYFLDEVQSDWAQRFRIQGESENFPKAPFISNTEAWAGLILKRQLQLAAMDPSVKHFAWTTAALRNGGGFDRGDNLDEFYTGIIPKIMNKFLKGTDQKVKIQVFPLNSNSTQIYEIPTIEMTDSVRRKALAKATLYSLDVNNTSATEEDRSVQITDQRFLLGRTTTAFQDAFLGAKEMFSGVFELRLVSHILDDVSRLPASGSFIGNVLNISLQGRDMLATLDHELWHLAESAIIDPIDVSKIHDAFQPGRKLNTAVRQALVADNANPSALAQCDDAAEAAAFGFALWRQGKLPVQPETAQESVGDTDIDRVVGTTFVRVEKAFHSLARWVRRLVVKQTKNELERELVQTAFERFGKALDNATIRASTARIRQHYESIEPEQDETLDSYSSPSISMRA